MDDNRISIYLNNRGIDPSVPFFNVEQEILEEMKQRDVYRSTHYELVNIHYSMKGQKKELVMKNCIIENMNFTQVQVSGKCVFYNCFFRNVKFSKCSFPGACFYHCLFEDTVIMDSSLKSSLFINNDQLEKVDMVNNNLDNVKIIGNVLDKEMLEEHNNKVENLYIRTKEYSIVTKEENNPQKELSREIIEKKIFENEQISKDKLRNILYSECEFINCDFEHTLNLDASLDFYKCQFRRMKIEHPLIQKVTFDQSLFDEVQMNSVFLHCSFVGCEFNNIAFDDHVAFKTCNFSCSNASAIFDIEKQRMEYVEFLNENKEDEQLNVILEDLYTLLKKRDQQLQKKLKLLDRDDVARDIMMDYLVELDDRGYIDFITDVGSKRKEGEHGKITG